MKTKRLLSAIAVLLFMMGSLVSFSQGLGLGVKGGINFSKYSNWDKQKDLVDGSLFDYTNTSNMGIQAGIILNPMFSKSFGLEVELNFEQKGNIYKVAESGLSSVVNGTMKYKYSYITLPILLKGGVDLGFFKIHALVGPYARIAIEGKVYTYDKDDKLTSTRKIQFGSGTATQDENTTGGPKGYKGFLLDVGVIAGIQPAIKLGPGDLIVDVRYSFGLMGIENPTSSNKTDWENMTDKSYFTTCNRSLAISLGYVFRLGK